MSEAVSAHSQYQLYRKQRYFSSLDGVRFISIIAVLWHHSFPEATSSWLIKGFLGVDMFFVLSGYLIVTLLLREKDKGTISLKKFYIRRCLRIFPVYFGLLLALAFLYGVVKNDPAGFSTFFSLLPIYLFFVANWSLVHIPNLEIYWSLATEEQFYLLWPFLEKLFSIKTIGAILFGFIILNQLINFGFLDSFFIWLYGTDKAVHLSIIDSTFTPICLGVLLAHALHRESSFNQFFSLLSHSLSPLIILVILLLTIFMSPGDISGGWRLAIQLLMFLWLGSLVVRENHILQPVMTSYPIKRIGEISYGMYVYHMFALHIVRVVIERFGITFDYSLFILGTLLTAIIAEMSFRFYEQPILKLKHRWT